MWSQSCELGAEKPSHTARRFKRVAVFTPIFSFDTPLLVLSLDSPLNYSSEGKGKEKEKSGGSKSA